MKSYPSKKTQHEMFEFFMRTSAPRLLAKNQAKERANKDKNLREVKE